MAVLAVHPESEYKYIFIYSYVMHREHDKESAKEDKIQLTTNVYINYQSTP